MCRLGLCGAVLCGRGSEGASFSFFRELGLLPCVLAGFARLRRWVTGAKKKARWRARRCSLTSSCCPSLLLFWNKIRPWSGATVMDIRGRQTLVRKFRFVSSCVNVITNKDMKWGKKGSAGQTLFPRYSTTNCLLRSSHWVGMDAENFVGWRQVPTSKFGKARKLPSNLRHCKKC